MKGINLGEPNTMFEERPLKVELDKKALYALASDTRMEILKALVSERRTLSQLSEHLDADKAGVHRHLKKLEEGGFVSKSDDHGFVYYSLTWKARDLISPGENTKIVILISSMFLVLIAIGLVLLSSAPVYDGGNDKGTDTNQAGEFLNDGGVEGGNGAIMMTGLLAIPLAVLSAVVYRKFRRPRQHGADIAETSERRGDRDISD